jgi:outer membrane autotransporter protein
LWNAAHRRFYVVDAQNAINFTGGINSLSIRNDTAISGRVVAFSRSDTLTFDSGATASSFNIGLLSQYVGFGHLVKGGAGTWTITGENRGSGMNLNLLAGRLDLVGANWELFGQSYNSGTMSVGAGSLVRINDRGAFTNRATLTVEAGGDFDGRFENAGTVTNLARLRGEGFSNTGLIHNTATGFWSSDSAINRGSVVNDGFWEIRFGGTASNEAGTFNNNASGTFTGLLTNTAGATNNRGTINGNVTISGGNVFLIGTGSIAVRPIVVGIGRDYEAVQVSIEACAGLPDREDIDRCKSRVIRNPPTKEVVKDVGSGRIAITGAAGTFDISGTTAGATISSLDGVANSRVTLGTQTLTILNGFTTTDGINPVKYAGMFQGNFAGIIQGTGGLTIAGGTQVLSGINTYTGATNINAGNLVVNGSIASSSVVNVNSGGILSGSGTLGQTNNNGGTISPGNSVGTITINGNYNMGPSSRYYAEINGDTSDLIKVSGASDIQSSVFEIAHDTNKASAPVLPGKTYTLITTGGGLTGTSPDVAIADFPFLTFNLFSDGFNGYLTTARGPGAFAELATTGNEKGVANALDAAAATNPLWQQVVGATEAQARSAFTSLSNASIHANAAGVLSAQSHYLRDAVTDRLRQDFAYGTSLAVTGNVLSYTPETPRNAYAAASAIPFYKAPPLAAASTSMPVYAVWAQALGSWGSLKGDGNAAQTDHSLSGVISGADVTFNGRWRVGLAGGYSQSIFRSPSIAASGSSDSYHVSLYGGGMVGAWGLRGGASFSWNDILTSRQVTVVNLAGPQRGDYASKTTQVFGEVGHQFTFAAGGLEPFANIAYVNVDGGINEFGVAAVSGSAKLSTTYTTLGVRGATALTSTLTARGMLGWRHALGDITPVAALAFQSGGAAFTLAGSPIARDALAAEAGLDLAIAPNASLGISWTGQFADQSHDNAVKGNFRWRF